MPKKLLLVDAPYHAFRAYHGIQSDMRAPDGFPTRALFGFSRVLLAMLRDAKPDYIALVFDVGNSFRNELHPEYKGQRPDMPADLREQWSELAPLAQAFGFVVIAVPGTEADDVIGTLAVRFGCPDVDVLIVSGDKDFGQLVNEHIHVYDPIKKQESGPVEVRERWGVGPERIIDLLALMGDTVDNVKGVPGVGEKKAAQFINQYGDVEAVLANWKSIGGKTGEAVRDYADVVRLAKVLVTIDLNQKVDHTLEDLKLQPRNDADLTERLTRYNFRSMMAELKLDPGSVAVTPVASKMTAASGPVAAKVIWGPGQLARLREAMITAGRSVVSVNGDRAMIAFDGPGERLVTVPLDAAGKSWLREVLADPAVPKTGCDIKGLAHAVGTELNGVVGDIRLADYLRVPEVKRGLGDVYKRWFDADLPATTLTDPGAAAMATLRLDRLLEVEVAKWNAERVYREIDLPVLSVLCRMENNGILLDLPALNALRDELNGRLEIQIKEIHELAGGPFNLNSTHQLAQILFEKLGLKGAKKTTTGWSTDADTLDKLRDEHPLPGAILGYRELFKLVHTYLDTLPKFVAADGRIHTTYDPTVAATGRLSSNDPNLQNIPVRSEDGRRIRHCFVAAPGHVFLSADYSQIELRLLAHYCQTGPLVESFRNGEDIHRRTASEIFNVAPAFVSSEQRRAAKAINFGIVYGMGPARLANDLRIKRTEAQKYIDGYFARYPQVRLTMDAACARARENGFATTLYGRRRAVEGLDANNPMDRSAAERVAINTPIQGSAADLIKLAMIAVDKAIAGTNARMLLQVHDELVLEVPEGEAEGLRAVVKAAMEGVKTFEGESLCVPLLAETGVSRTWGGAH